MVLFFTSHLHHILVPCMKFQWRLIDSISWNYLHGRYTDHINSWKWCENKYYRISTVKSVRDFKSACAKCEWQFEISGFFQVAKHANITRYDTEVDVAWRERNTPSFDWNQPWKNGDLRGRGSFVERGQFLRGDSESHTKNPFKLQFDRTRRNLHTPQPPLI